MWKFFTSWFCSNSILKWRLTNLENEGSRDWSVIDGKTPKLKHLPVGNNRKKVKSLSRVWLFATPWTVAYQASLSMGFSRQKYWSGLPFLFQRIFPIQGWNPHLLHCRQVLYHWTTCSCLFMEPGTQRGRKDKELESIESLWEDSFSQGSWLIMNDVLLSLNQRRELWMEAPEFWCSLNLACLIEGRGQGQGWLSPWPPLLLES